uniref:Large ribosomal subunit protein uL5c n=1 Tax=Pseudobryopsis hainanensis TaxID=2320808 RepID=A0A3S5X2R2_9CHLO|nr:ribosomal protein L5 [Pseudobryopsis hainanensis]
MIHRLKNYYRTAVMEKLLHHEDFDWSNPHQIPRLSKIVINRGIGDASQNARILESSLEEIKALAGQRGVITRSKKSIAGFKLRQKMPVGVCVTLRDELMYGFLERLIHLALPRIRDFQGLATTSFDGSGNYSLGLEEQLMFPEIDYDRIHQIRGMDITIVTTAKTDRAGFYLLKEFGLPFLSQDFKKG